MTLRTSLAALRGQAHPVEREAPQPIAERPVYVVGDQRRTPSGCSSCNASSRNARQQSERRPGRHRELMAELNRRR
jgi:hypothetical protein